MHHIKLYLIFAPLSIIILLFCSLSTVCGKDVSTPGSKAGLANPASTNCIEKGGKLVIQKRNDGGEYGVCVFDDNRQCEEWALFRGECPAGGIRVTGCVSPAALFCAITGGQYSEINLKRGSSEQGTCTFKNGHSCDAGDYYDGKCSKYF